MTEAIRKVQAYVGLKGRLYDTEEEAVRSFNQGALSEMQCKVDALLQRQLVHLSYDPSQAVINCMSEIEELFATFRRVYPGAPK